MYDDHGFALRRLFMNPYCASDFTPRESLPLPENKQFEPRGTLAMATSIDKPARLFRDD
jgi:hypothetical protein